MTQYQRVMYGLAWLALIGAGFRAGLLGFALATGRATPAGRAKRAAAAYAVIALAGLAGVVTVALRAGR